jgi:predicted kinase
MKLKPCLILVSGPPGAGKSTFTQPLIKEFGLTWLEIDCVGDPFTLERNQEYITNIEPKIIPGLLNLAALNLRAGQSVILDLPWKHLLINNPAWVQHIHALVETANVPLIVFECHVSETELRRRIVMRNAPRDLAKIQSEDTWSDFLTHIHFQAQNPLAHVLINTENTPEFNFAYAVNYLNDNQ